MRVLVVTPPDRFVTYEEAVARLKLDINDADVEQADVESMIDGVISSLDGPGDPGGRLGRALGPQTLEARLDRFDDLPNGSIFLPYRPIIDVVSIKYVDDAGAEQTIDPATYELLGAELIPAYNCQWPTPRRQREAVRIQYRAGYAVDPASDPLVADVPAAIRNAILLLVGDLYANRETNTAATASTVVELPSWASAKHLLSTARVWE